MRFFYAWQRIKYGHGMRIFQAFIKKFFFAVDVTRLLSVVVMLLVFESSNAGSVLTKTKSSFLRKRNRNFLQSFLGSFVWKFLQSFCH